MTLLEALVTVLLAIVGPGGIIVLVITFRMRARADAVAASVGPATDDGTIHDQLRTIVTTLRTVATNSELSLDRIRDLEDGRADHDQRIGALDETIGAHGQRLTALEMWQHQFGVDADDRLNPPAKEAS